jgi:predicted NBD/HSP70 family sugar kinase
MSPRYKAKTKATTAKANTQLPTINPHAAGIDIGATSLQVAVPSDADPKPVRTFTTFTDDLLKLRERFAQAAHCCPKQDFLDGGDPSFVGKFR